MAVEKGCGVNVQSPKVRQSLRDPPIREVAVTMETRISASPFVMSCCQLAEVGDNCNNNDNHENNIAVELKIYLFIYLFNLMQTLHTDSRKTKMEPPKKRGRYKKYLEDSATCPQTDKTTGMLNKD